MLTLKDLYRLKIFMVFVFYIGLSQASASSIVAYVTDLEGSRQRFEQFMRNSEAFVLGKDGKFHLKLDAHFVFGGDAPDRYIGSRWVVAELVRLKEETPDRVALILGNRDINKMRLTSELSTIALTKPPIKFHFTKEDDWKKHIGPETKPERLKYIFSATMGAPQAFDLRRKELATDLKINETTISDDQVVESFLSELETGGAFRRLLELGQLAHRIGNTLFVHGGVTNENLGLIPGDARRRVLIDEWITDLNKWLRAGVNIWEEDGNKWQGEGVRPEQEWLDYPMPNPGMNSKPESVVTGRNSDANNNPHLPSSDIIAKLLNQGIERVVIGHTPTGDYPAILRTNNERFELISADNSYAKSELIASLIHFKGDGLNESSARGMLTIETGTVEVSSDISLGKPTPIGKKLNGGLLLGHLTSDPSSLVSFHYGERFRIITEVIPMSNIDKAKLLEPTANCETLLVSPKQQ